MANRQLTIALVVIAVAAALSLATLGYSYLAERVFLLQEPVARVTLVDSPPLEITRGDFYNIALGNLNQQVTDIV
jgi:hypothetical protein